MTRARLPNRRPCETETLEVGGQTFEACVGFDPETWQPREVFLTGGKEGSDFDAMLADAAVVISVALQHGVSAGMLVKSVARLPNFPTSPGCIGQLLYSGTEPASPIGAALDFMVRQEPGAAEHDHR